MRICRVITTQKIIEMQSDAREGTLIGNAVAAGFNISDVEELEVTPEQYMAMMSPPALTYQQIRAAAYPPMADYLDAIVKGDDAQLQAYKDACLAVKAKYPKV
jgi:hypothetical protein